MTWTISLVKSIIDKNEDGNENKHLFSSRITEIKDDGHVFKLDQYVEDLLNMRENFINMEKSKIIRHLHQLGFTCHEDSNNSILINDIPILIECDKTVLMWLILYINPYKNFDIMRIRGPWTLFNLLKHDHLKETIDKVINDNIWKVDEYDDFC